MNGYENNTSPTAVPQMQQQTSTGREHIPESYYRTDNTRINEHEYAQKLIAAQREALGRVGQLTGTSLGPNPTPKETPNIKAALVQLNANIVGMNEVISALEEKLHPVMKPYIEESERPTEARNGSDVGQELWMDADRIVDMTLRLGMLIKRLEV